MKVAFAGTPDFARVALSALHAATAFDIPLVLTQPDRPAGRGLQLQGSPVKTWAGAHGIPVVQPRSLRFDGRFPDDAAQARDALQAAAPDVMVVAAYGLLLPDWVLCLPPFGCINIHASLLPRWRGAAPIHRAIEAGDPETGITIMQMDEGLDTGPVLRAAALPIQPDDTTATLQERLAALGGTAIVRVLDELAKGVPPRPVPQPTTGVTYSHKVEKQEARLDWSLPAVVLERRLRAFDPFPGSTAGLGGETIKCWRGRVVAGAGTPGEVVSVGSDAIGVASGVDVLELTQLQRAGGRRLSAREFLQRTPLAVGARFELPI
jgi:methionyl-tRNA formyltransferase